MGLPWWLSGKESACNSGATVDADLISGAGRSQEGIATHSSILAWKIPQTEEPGRPQSIELESVGHN